jgi:hypothetical protein
MILAYLFAGLSFLTTAPTAIKPLKPAPKLVKLVKPLESLATARVSQAQGKYVFCYSQPVAPYDVAFSFATTLQPSEKMTLSTVIGQCLTSAMVEAGSQLKPFDAILIQAGQRDLANKFRDGVSPEQRALATAPRNEGKYVFMFCEPVADYEVVKTEGVSWYNHAFGGAFYTMGHVQENLLKTAKKNERIEAVLIGETATFISFKK